MDLPLIHVQSCANIEDKLFSSMFKRTSYVNGDLG